MYVIKRFTYQARRVARIAIVFAGGHDRECALQFAWISIGNRLKIIFTADALWIRFEAGGDICN